ncbi:MAG: Crp/Fnr family transcriptional regulator [Mariprofundaceae bacterium]
MNDDSFLDLSGVHPASSLAGDLLDGARFPLLAGMSPVHLRILNNSSNVMYVSKDVELLHEGDAPHDLYFVDSGKVIVAKRSGGKMKVLRTLGPGEVFGEFGVLRKKSRFASVFTAESSRIIRVDQTAVNQVLEVDVEFRERLVELMNRRMLSTFFASHPVFQVLSTSAAEQLARVLPLSFVERGEHVFTQGDAPKGMYLILSGEVEVRFLNKANAEVLLEVRRDNDILGEVLQKNGTAFAYTAVAASDVDLLLLDKKSMQQIRAADEAAFKRLEQYIDKRSQITVKRLKENLS